MQMNSEIFIWVKMKTSETRMGLKGGSDSIIYTGLLTNLICQGSKLKHTNRHLHFEPGHLKGSMSPIPVTNPVHLHKKNREYNTPTT